MQRFAIYDMDKTVTRVPTWTAFLISTARRDTPWRLALLPLAGAATAAYLAKVIDRSRLKTITQRLLLGNTMTEARATAAANAFAERIAAHGVFSQARAQIAADRAAGYRIVMATASYAFYAGAIGRRLDFDAIIGTNTRRDAKDRLLAAIEGENCYGPAKLRMIEAWLAREGIVRADAHVRFYSDHISDTPTFAWADEAFAVNPHAALRALASLSGWTVLNWKT